MTEKLIDKLKQAGLDVQQFNAVPVNSDEGRRILNELTTMSVNYDFKNKERNENKKDSATAPEKSIRPQSNDTATAPDKSIHSKSNGTVVTASDKSAHSKSNGTAVSESNAKIDKILQNLEKHYQKSPNYAKGFITDVARSLNFEKHGQSRYRNFRLPDGQLLSVRLSKHNARIKNFDERNEKDGLSIVISPNNNRRLNNDGIAHVTEFYYSKRQLESVESYKPLAEIVKSLRNALQTGEYVDTTGLAVRQEVNAEKMFMQIIAGENKPFYSNAEKAVKDIKQNKATPAQWLAMLTNKGGIKAGEDKWLGLSQWLKDSTEKSLTKSQMLDYINSHRINLHEDFYTEIKHSEKFKELKKEFVRRINEAQDGWIAADRELESFYNEMKDKYGDEWEYEMNSQEQELEDELQEQRDHYDVSCYDQSERAFQEMVEIYGSDFDEGFYYESGELEVIDDSIVARKFLEEGIIDETRLEYTTDKLDRYNELAFWVEDIAKWKENDTIHFGEVGNGRCIGWVRFGETNTPVSLSPEEIEQNIQNMPKADAWTKVDGKNFVTGHDIYYPPGHTSKYVKSDMIVHHHEKGCYVFSPCKGDDVVCDSLEEAVNIYNRNHIDRQKSVRTLVIDEIQSRRHQEANRKQGENKVGYRKYAAPDDPERIKFEKIHQEYEDFFMSITEKYGPTWVVDGVSPEDRQMIDEWHERHRKAEIDYNQYQIDNQLGLFCKSDIPEAPFEKNWHELAMKRILRYAAENGFDQIVWTTGEIQVERYNISKVVDTIDVYTDPHPAADERAAWKTITCNTADDSIKILANKQGRIVNDVRMGNSLLQDKSLDEVFGKEYAQIIMSQPAGYKFIDTGSIKIGGQGMKTFYDQVLPTFMNKYGKQWGVSVHPVELPQLNSEKLENGIRCMQKCIMHGIDITPAMKVSVMQGQPMFMRDKQGELYGFTMGDTIYLTPKGMRPETVVHEYTHIWAMAMMNGNPEGWQSVKSLLKDTALWDEVRQDPLYADIRDNDDYVASEALARISGRENAAKINAFAQQTAQQDKQRGKSTTPGIILNRLRSALGKFWSWVGKHMFDIKQFNSVSEVTDRVLYDLLKADKLETGKAIGKQQTATNPRITDITVYEGKLGIPHIRCKIDGVQQMGRPLAREDFEQWTEGGKTDNLVEKYFKQELTNQQNLTKNWKR